MPQIRATPKNGLSVQMPDAKRFLAAGGEDVEDSVYWRRRAADGDVEISDVKPVSRKSGGTNA